MGQFATGLLEGFTRNLREENERSRLEEQRIFDTKAGLISQSLRDPNILPAGIRANYDALAELYGGKGKSGKETADFIRALGDMHADEGDQGEDPLGEIPGGDGPPRRFTTAQERAAQELQQKSQLQAEAAAEEVRRKVDYLNQALEQGAITQDQYDQLRTRAHTGLATPAPQKERAPTRADVYDPETGEIINREIAAGESYAPGPPERTDVEAQYDNLVSRAELGGAGPEEAHAFAMEELDQMRAREEEDRGLDVQGKKSTIAQRGRSNQSTSKPKTLSAAEINNILRAARSQAAAEVKTRHDTDTEFRADTIDNPALYQMEVERLYRAILVARRTPLHKLTAQLQQYLDAGQAPAGGSSTAAGPQRRALLEALGGGDAAR